MRRVWLLGLVAVLTAAAAALATAQTSAPQTYRPGLADLMIATIQSRHIKLGLAGRNQNWSLAAFELGEMDESFDRVVRVWPTWRSFSIADMVEVVKSPMAAVQAAIKAKDAARFAAAYGELTAACNACHTGVNRGMIVIHAPDASPYPDQDFAPKAQ